MAREAAGESVVSGGAYDALALGSGRRGNRRAPSFGPEAPSPRRPPAREHSAQIAGQADRLHAAG